MPDTSGVASVRAFRFNEAPYVAVSERSAGQPLSTFDGMPESAAWKLIRRIVDALGEARKHGVSHGHLHPGNILIEDAEADPKPVITDFGSGLVGDIHHIDLGETTYYSAPEQLECAGREWEHGGVEKWDVYSFGLIAYGLITERLPRGLGYLKHRNKELAQSGGRPVPIDIDAYLTEVRKTESPAWGMSFGLSKEFKLYRAIIDRCLELDPAKRPVDLREVRNQFRSLDQQFAIEDAEERVLKERRKQKAKLFGARAMALLLGTLFVCATYFLVDYLKKTYFFQNQVTQLDQVVVTQQAHISHLDEQWADTVTDLKQSREAADDFFQKMAHGGEAGGSGVAALGAEDLEKSRDYYLKTLEDVEESEGTDLEKARAIHSLAHIERKMGLREEAVARFRGAVAEFQAIDISSDVDPEIVTDVHRRLADSHEYISSLLDDPTGVEALASLREAAAEFDNLISLRPDDARILSRQAATTFNLGKAYEAHLEYEEAVAAYSKSAELAMALRESSPDSEPLTELIGKLQYRAASSLRKLDRIDDAVNAHVAAMETVEELRGVDGFDPLQSIQMASSFIELGELFSTKEATEEDLDQLYNEALRLLTPLNTENPSDVEVAVLLCRSLVHLGALERDAGQWTTGYRLSVRGIESLSVALEGNNEHVEGLFVLAESRLEHLKFYDRREDTAVTIALRGVESAEEARDVLSGYAFLPQPQLTERYRRLSAIFREFGEVCERLGESAAAKNCFEQATMNLSRIDEKPVEVLNSLLLE